MITWVLILLIVAVSAKTDGPQRLSRRLQQDINTLVVSSNNLVSQGQNVSVTWTIANGVNTTKQDNIALYIAPVSTTFYEMVPLKLKPTNGATSGTVTFTLLNFRQDMQFAYVSNSTGKFTPLMTSDVIKNTNPNEPTQIHISTGPDAQSYSVVWVSANSQMPTVKFGLSADILDTSDSFINGADTTTYNQSDIMHACGWGNTPISALPANASMKSVTTGWIDPGLFHVANMAGLNYSTTYYYKVGDVATNNFSPVYSFTTLPPPGSRHELTIMYTADNGIVDSDGSVRDKSHNSKGSGALAVLTAMNTVSSSITGPAVAVLNGDISYSDGTLSDWQVFLDEFQPTATKLPAITLPGNHERDYYYNSTVNSMDAIKTPNSYGGECGIPYETLFQKFGINHTVQWWSAEYGPVFFMQLDSELDMSPNSPQMQWAASTLSSVNRYDTPYVIVSLHRPLLTPMPADNKDTLFGDKLISYGWEDLFYKNNVTFVVTGHVHLYSRSCPVYQKSCVESGNLDGSFVPSAPVYVVTGWGGPYEDSTTPKDYWTVEAPAGSFGFLTFQANRDAIIMNAIPVDWSVNGTGTMMPMSSIDTVIIPSGKWGQAPPPPHKPKPHPKSPLHKKKSPPHKGRSPKPKKG